ncbi:hypothetical protein VIBNISFn118_20016 [Vibrio nigripulchritudo SFn118]|nr:hypothetical protein VIBNISFn118_20016 [Vibrio nigripulchritudo SFn118]
MWGKDLRNLVLVLASKYRISIPSGASSQPSSYQNPQVIEQRPVVSSATEAKVNDAEKRRERSKAFWFRFIRGFADNICTNQ